ncbi:MAG: hypothetical protein CMF59_17285 [Leptospiraceae bacterium]|nr:hypothetical protein [Leptospiraceae bacterium]
MYKQYRSAPTARNHIEKNAGEICFEGFQPASRKQLNGFSTRKIAGVFPVLEPRTARGTARGRQAIGWILCTVLACSVFANASVQADSPEAVSRNEESLESANPDLNVSTEVSEFERKLWMQVKNHPGIVKEKLRYSAQEARATYADFTYPDPEIRITRGSGSQEERAAYPTNYNLKDASSYEVQVTQPIPFPGKLTAKSNVQEYQADQKGYEFLMNRNRTIGELLGLLARYHRVEESLRFTRELAGAAAALEGIARARYGAGKGSLSDVSLARVQADTFRERAEMLLGELESIRDELQYFRRDAASGSEGDGREGEHSIESFLLKKEPFQQYLRDLQNRTYHIENLPILARVRSMQQEAESRKTLANLDYAPDLGVFAAYGKEDRNLIYPSGTGKQTTYKLGLQIRIPLWSGLSNHKNLEAADQDRKAAEQEQLDVKRQIQAKIASLDERIRKGRTRQAIYTNRLVPNSWTARRSSVLSYQGGSADFTSVIQAWNAYYNVNLQKLALEEQIAMWIVARSELTNTLLLAEENENE